MARFSPKNGQPVPEGKKFTRTDERAANAGRKSGKSRRDKADLRKMAALWLSENVTTDKDGKPLTGAELMVRVAVKEMSKGNSKFWELLRDTAGFKPVDKVMVADVDESIINEVEEMVYADDSKN